MTAMPSELPLRPRPMANETLLGYLLRVSHTNGYRQVQTMRDLFGLEGMPLPSITCDNRHLDRVASSMSRRLRLSPETLVVHFENELDGAFDDGRVIKSIVVKSPKVCIACIAEIKPIQAKWRLTHVTHCEEHCQPLVSCCPECQTPLKWTPQIYSKCENCQVEWRENESKVDSLPLYQVAEQGLSLVQQQHYRRHLYRMAGMAMRFYDFQAAAYAVFPDDVQNVSSLFEFSYRCLVDEKFRLRQFQSRVDYWKKKGLLEHIPHSFFIHLHANYIEELGFLPRPLIWPVKPFHVMSFQSKRVSNPHAHLNFRDVGTHFLVDRRTLADCLSVATSDVTSMVKAGLLSPSYDSTSLRYSWYDVRDIDQLLARLMACTKPMSACYTSGELITVFEAQIVLRRFNWSVADILVLLISKQCDSFLKASELNFSNLAVNREQLFDALNKRLGKQNDYNEHTLARDFYVPPEVRERFYDFVRSEKAKLPGELNSLLFFTDHYVVLNQWCRLRKLSIPSIFRYLMKQGIVTEFSEMAGRGFYVFRKSDLLERSLSEVVKNDS
ncbi:TniQ family protein [Agarivorans albus]|nr:TniQ family protein [Agarivorans albus]